jgi:hypothetical protein
MSMVRSAFYKDILAKVSASEQEACMQAPAIIEQAGNMVSLLQDILLQLRDKIQASGFTDTAEEIEFFRFVKPQIVGKLIFYNEIYRIETTCPVQGGKMYRKYFQAQLKMVKQNHASKLDMNFYRYYRSGRRDRDKEFFQRGQLHFSSIVDSFYFEMDKLYSSYYDHLVAKIIAHDLLYAFLLSRIDPDSGFAVSNADFAELRWTGTKNALIELIYALYVSGSISNGKVGVRKVSAAFQGLFKMPLGDIHHAFHRMKDRAGHRTLFIEKLRDSLEQYMDRNI